MCFEKHKQNPPKSYVTLETFLQHLWCCDDDAIRKIMAWKNLEKKKKNMGTLE